MTYQSGKNVVVAYKEQSVAGTAETGSGGLGLRVRPSQGAQLNAQSIRSGEVRRDGMTTLGRLGSLLANAQYETELSVGSLDTILEAILRGTWAASFDLDQTDVTSITTTGSTIVGASGSWITLGIRVGQMIKLTGHSTAANNGKWLRVLGVTASTITVPTGELTLDASADTSFTLTVAKYLISSNPPDDRIWTIEEHFQDVDASKVTRDARWAYFTMQINPDSNINVGLRAMGIDIDSPTGASAPGLTSPTFTTTSPLVLLDGSLRVNGVDRADVTGFTLGYDGGGAGQSVVTSRQSPDIFLKNAEGTGSISAIMNDLTEFDSFKAEDRIELFLMAAENEADPADFVSIYAGNAAYRGHQGPFGQDGGLIETMPFEFGVDERGSEYAETMLLISTSAA